jgi:hypothetical protein
LESSYKLDSDLARTRGDYLRAIDQILKQAYIKKAEIYEALESNEKEALSVGLDGLDKDLNGYLTPEEVTELSARVFRILSGGKDRITHESLQNCISRLQRVIKDLQDQIQDLLAERSQLSSQRHSELVAADIEKIIEKVDYLRDQLKEEKKLLRSVYKYFFLAFCMHLFGKLPEQIIEPEVTVDMLIQELSQLQQEIVKDPFELKRDDLKFRRALLAAAMGLELVKSSLTEEG